MSTDFLATAVIWFVPVLLSLTVHEWAHAASAYKLGDDTAAMAGRLTLNPFAHMDLLGTVIVPILQLVGSGTVLFAWAKPVPVNPARFSRKVSMRTGSVLVSAAGPASNLLIALSIVVGVGLAVRFGGVEGMNEIFARVFLLNVALAVFNLLPIPPLDGSHVLHGLLPTRAAAAYERIFPYAPMLLIGVLIFGRGLITVPMSWVSGVMSQIFFVLAG